MFLNKKKPEDVQIKEQKVESDEEISTQITLIKVEMEQEGGLQAEIFNFDEVSSGDDRYLFKIDDRGIEDEIQSNMSVSQKSHVESKLYKQDSDVQSNINEKQAQRQVKGGKGYRKTVTNTLNFYQSQFEPGLNFEEGSDLPELGQLDNHVKYEELSNSIMSIRSQSYQLQKGQHNNVVVMRQKVEKEESDDEDFEVQSQVDFQMYQESNRDEPQIQDDFDCQQSDEEPNAQPQLQKRQTCQLEVIYEKEGKSKKPKKKAKQQEQFQEGGDQVDKKKDNRDHILKMGANSSKSPFPPRFDMSTFPSTQPMMRHFLTNPIPQGVTLQCYIKRQKSGLAMLYPVYHLYTTQGSQYMLTAKKIMLNSASNYIICMQKDNLSNKSENYLGQVKSNFMGTEFMLFDNGINPKKTKNSTIIRNQLGVIFYESNFMANKGPRKMQIVVPRVNLENNLPKQYMPLNSKEGIQYDYTLGKHEFLDIFVNKPPKWNDQISAYVLNFYGRVDKPSVKNFQLIRPQPNDSMQFQFGRVDDLNFNLDFTWPFSPLQAMQICVSSFDFKFACE